MNLKTIRRFTKIITYSEALKSFFCYRVIGILDNTLPSTWTKSTQAEIQNDCGSLGLAISLKTRSRLSHLIKRESLMFSLWQYCLDFPILTMIASKFHFSPTFTSNLFFWTRNKNGICLKHMTSSTLVKCNGMIISIVMPSYLNVTLFLCYISEHWITARTLNMTIDHKIP